MKFEKNASYLLNKLKEAKFDVEMSLADLTYADYAAIIYACFQLNLNIPNYFLSLITVVCATISLYSIWFMLGATSIWFVKIYNVTEVLRGLLEAGRYPISAYPAAYRIFFTLVVPVTFLTTVPAETLLGRNQGSWLLFSGLLAIVLLIVSHCFWQFALRFYTSASS